MRIRRFRKEDSATLVQWYDESKHGIKCPDFAASDMAAVFVLVDEDEVPRMALGGRKTVEMMLIADPDWETPANRLAGLKALAKEAFKTLFTLGYKSAHCWIEEALMKSYPRRLKAMGMLPDERKSFRLEVE